MTDEEIRAIRERADKATKGPWIPDYDSCVCVSNSDKAVIIIDSGVTNIHREFIAHARTDVPNLADECLARGRRIAELEECRRLLEKLVNNHCHDLGCAICRDYAPPNAECTCGLREAEAFLEKNK